jgi:hypothetical protein
VGGVGGEEVREGSAAGALPRGARAKQSRLGLSQPPPVAAPDPSGQEEDDADAGAPASGDDGSVIDQSGSEGPGADAATVGVVGVMGGDGGKGAPGRGAAQQQGGRPGAAAREQQAAAAAAAAWQDQGAGKQPPQAQMRRQQQVAAAAAAPATAGGPVPVARAPAALHQQQHHQQQHQAQQQPRASPAPAKPLPPAPVSAAAAAAAAPPPGAAAPRPDSAGSGGTGEGYDPALSSSGGAVTVASLIWHPSDLSVKPIVANRRIERLPEPRFDARALPFQPLSLPQLLDTDQKVGGGGGGGAAGVRVRRAPRGLNGRGRQRRAARRQTGGAVRRRGAGRGAGLRQQGGHRVRGRALTRSEKPCLEAAPAAPRNLRRPALIRAPPSRHPGPPLPLPRQALEAFLTQIYRALAAATPLKDKVNVLTYFETLCVDTNAANVLINSSLTMLFVRMLRNSRAPLLRVRLASVLGLLVRHATFISDDLAATQVRGPALAWGLAGLWGLWRQ